MKYGLWLLAACLLCTAASASVKLAPEGIEIDGGAMGKLTFLYPKFTSPDGKSVSPEVKLSGDGPGRDHLSGGGNPRARPDPGGGRGDRNHGHEVGREIPLGDAHPDHLRREPAFSHSGKTAGKSRFRRRCRRNRIWRS